MMANTGRKSAVVTKAQVMETLMMRLEQVGSWRIERLPSTYGYRIVCRKCLAMALVYPDNASAAALDTRAHNLGKHETHQGHVHWSSV